MITKHELIKGTTNELAEYFDSLTETTRIHLADRNMLNCKDGFLQQLDRIPSKISLVYYLIVTKNDVDCNMNLKQTYVHIEDKGNGNN